MSRGWTALRITGGVLLLGIVVMILVAAITDLGPSLLRSLQRSRGTILLAGLAVAGTFTLFCIYRPDFRVYVPGFVLLTAAVANRLAMWLVMSSESILWSSFVVWSGSTALLLVSGVGLLIYEVARQRSMRKQGTVMARMESKD